MVSNFTYSYSQNPNVETLFQLAMGPHAAIIFLIIASGTFSLMFPKATRTIISNNFKIQI